MMEFTKSLIKGKLIKRYKRFFTDVAKTIIDTLNLLKSTYNYVFTTGGIGPTHDDITAESVSKTSVLKYELEKEAFKMLEAY